MTTILKNAQITKLKEYSRSYGGIETIEVPYVIEHYNSIDLVNNVGVVVRTMRKGTKVLISFKGTACSETAMKRAVNKAKKDAATERKAREAHEASVQAANRIIADKQLEAWRTMLQENTERLARYKAEIQGRPSNSSRSGNWRNWIRLKAAKHINNGKFEGLLCSAPELAEVLNGIR